MKLKESVKFRSNRSKMYDLKFCRFLIPLLLGIVAFTVLTMSNEENHVDYLNPVDVERNVSDQKADADRWQLLGDSDFRNQIHSAYFDERQEIIGG
jgi:hypothetical protein